MGSEDGCCGSPTPLSDSSRGDSLDGFDRALLEFVSVWAVYGGPPDEELLPRFGVSRADLSAKIHEIVLATEYLDCRNFKSAP